MHFPPRLQHWDIAQEEVTYEVERKKETPGLVVRVLRVTLGDLAHKRFGAAILSRVGPDHAATLPGDCDGLDDLLIGAPNYAMKALHRAEASG